MDCAGIRDLAHEYLKGWCEPSQARTIESHLAGCAGCRNDLEETRSRLALLQALPEIETSPETWKKIEAAIAPRRAAGFRVSIRVAAAAGLLVAALSFAVLYMPRTRALPVVVGTRKALEYNETFQADQFTTLAIPDAGTLKLNAKTTLRFLDARTVLLESGELFAEIQPSGRGFEVRTADTAVRVHGTRFGVSSPSTVYVVEGKVEVTSPRGRVSLGANQAAEGGRLLEVTAADYLRWLEEIERPAVRLKLDPRDLTTITPGAPLAWHFILETDALAPLHLGDLRDISQILSLQIGEAHVSLAPENVEVRAARADGRVRLDSSHPCVIICPVDPALFREKGRVAVRAVFTSGTNAPPGTWVGIVRSPAVNVEVK